MTEQIEVTEEMISENGHNAFLDVARKVLMASIGVVAVAQDEVEDFVNRLVERGEIAEKDGRKMLTDLSERRKSATDKTQHRAQDQFDKRVEDILHRLNVPSKVDIDELGKKINSLSRKIDKLAKMQEK